MLQANSGNHQASIEPITTSGKLMIGDRVNLPTGKTAIYRGCDRVGTPTEEHEFEYIEGKVGKRLAISRPNLWIAKPA